MAYKEFSRFLTLTANTEGNRKNLIGKFNKTFLRTKILLLKFLPKNEKLYCNKHKLFNCFK
jgi:hypothetical protein